ncbi:uncharacterized protein [Parasteatoda tepidariorum]|uniref:uncharacterized protein n=1 Tax=Parasteatoda tepidariorum TaxID=114398 RepID=UPI001C71B157|nr:uncharacterized protein LOC107437274 [Parasteatoda tepidariorum]
MNLLWSLCGLVLLVIATVEGRVAFIKSTGLSYGGFSYFTIRNVSLHECQRWCRDDTECEAAAFDYSVRMQDGLPETTCTLQNDTSAGKSNVAPKRGKHTYYLTKMNINSDHLCDRLWTFEWIPNKILRGLDNAIIFTSNRESCLAACLSEVRFVCRSVEFNVVTHECHLSEFDRRSPGANVHLVDSQGIDYLENFCLQSSMVCPGPKHYNYLQVGLSQAAVTSYVQYNYYPDKQIVVNSRQDCLHQCTTEESFICRSTLFKPDTRPGKALCVLYHLDHTAFPGGSDDMSTANPQAVIGGERSRFYLETVCGNGPAEGLFNQVPEQKPEFLHDTTPKTAAVMEAEQDASCDGYGVCYDVKIRCSDTKIVVFVETSRPFHGRVYALGRSETCNAHIHNSQNFQLDLSLTGQDCNTQSLAGVYTNTVVLQHHNVVLTKADKMYNVRCTYETTSRNVSFGMIPVRDPATLEVSGAPEAPLPQIVILGRDGREAGTVRIGDRLTFHIEIPEDTPYGIFARSCYAMAKDGRSTFEIIDDRGCPVDPVIFPRFLQVGGALESSYEAFRFTESYGVIFQCNVKYCVGKCEPAMCGDYLSLSREESWGRKKRSASSDSGPMEDEMTLSKEILVLDFGDEAAATSLHTPNSANETIAIHQSIGILDDCASRTSIMALGVTTALLLVIYICTVAYFVAHQRAEKEFRG